MKEITLIKDLHLSIKKLEEKTYKVEDEIFYPVEIDVLVCIKNNPEIGVVEISNKLAVTKSAVSQKIKILCQKGCLEFERKVGKHKIYTLTVKGFKVCDIHDDLAYKTFKGIQQALDKYSDEERESFINISEDLTAFLLQLDYEKEMKEM